MRSTRNSLFAVAIGGSIGFLAVRPDLGAVGEVLDAQAEILGLEIAMVAPVLFLLAVLTVFLFVLVEIVTGVVDLVTWLIRRHRNRNAPAEVHGDR